MTELIRLDPFSSTKLQLVRKHVPNVSINRYMSPYALVLKHDYRSERLASSHLPAVE